MAAIGRDWEERGGRYLEDCSDSKPVDDNDKSWFPPGHASWAYDEVAAKRLWELSLKLVGVANDD